jgi:hypothetical protein
MALVSAVVAAQAAHGGTRVLDLDGSQWEFDDVAAKAKGKARGIGTVKANDGPAVDVTLMPGDSWEATIEGAPILRGTYTRTDPTAKRLSLTLDAASVTALENSYEQDVEAAAAAQGVAVTMSLALAEAKTTLTITTKARTNTARAKLRAKFKFTGLASAPSLGGSDVPGKVIGTLKGVSAAIPLTDIAGGGVSLTFRNGPTPGAPALAPAEGRRWPLTAGRWLISPDRVRVTVTRIDLTEAVTYAQRSIDLPDVVVTYDRAAASLAPLRTTSVVIPDGTYVSMILYMSDTFEVLVDDPVNGVYTDPAAPTGFSAAAPTAGPDFVPITVEWSGGLEPAAQAYFSTPLVVGADSQPGIDVLIHAIHTIKVTASGPTVDYVQETRNPVEVFPATSGVGKAVYYTEAATALTIPNHPDGSYASVFIFYEDSTTPAYLFLASGNIGGPCPSGTGVSGAWNASPAVSPVWDADGRRAGGYLGRDGSGTIAWALPVDATYSVYDALMEMPEASSVGETSTISCQTLTSVPAPVSGDTYSSGAPPITPDFQKTVTLVAQ